MPLFFIIAIGLGAFTVGATAVDVTADSRYSAHTARAMAHANAAGFQASAYANPEDCVRAAVRQGLAPSVCPQG